MRRRAFIAGLGGAVAWPAVARGQQADRVRRVGILMPLAEDDPYDQARLAAFLQGLQETDGASAATCGSTCAGVTGMSAAFEDRRWH